MINYGHFVGGKRVAGTSGRESDVFQPMDGTVRAKVSLASKKEVRAAVENALKAQPEWAATNPQRRARVLMKFLELIAKNNDELADILAREHGKTLAEARVEVTKTADALDRNEIARHRTAVSQRVEGSKSGAEQRCRFDGA